MLFMFLGMFMTLGAAALAYRVCSNDEGKVTASRAVALTVVLGVIAWPMASVTADYREGQRYWYNQYLKEVELQMDLDVEMGRDQLISQILEGQANLISEMYGIEAEHHGDVRRIVANYFIPALEGMDMEMLYAYSKVASHPDALRVTEDMGRGLMTAALELMDYADPEALEQRYNRMFGEEG